MAKMRTVLLASDFSARSDRPLDRALILSREWNGRLLIGHVLEEPAKGIQPKGSDEVHDALRKELPEPAREAELVVRTGKAPDVITALAKERGSDLIVTGVARYNSWGDYFLGTAVDHIIRHTNVPVLVVRRRPLCPYRKMLVATDFSECSLVALIAAARLFPDVSIILLHVWHVPFEAFLKSDNTSRELRQNHTAEMAKFLENPLVDPQLKARIVIAIEEGELGTVVNQYVNAYGIDLVALGTHGRSGFVHATIGSIALDLLKRVRTDALVVRAPAPK
jgi:nucleotide-binding universal stress UspA family protein